MYKHPHIPVYKEVYHDARNSCCVIGGLDLGMHDRGLRTYFEPINERRLMIQILSITIMVILLIEALILSRRMLRYLRKLNRYYICGKRFRAVAESVTKARLLAEQGQHAACLRELDRTNRLLYLAGLRYQRILPKE